MCGVAMLVSSQAFAVDSELAKTHAAQGQAELELHHATTAATLFDQAYADGPHPLWRIAAADAWLQALDAARACERLEQALADPRLLDPTRPRAEERLRLATKLTPLFARARAATRDQDHARAHATWLEAFALYPFGAAELEAARSAQRARLPAASTLYVALAERTDLSLEQHAEVADVLSRLSPAQVSDRPPPPAPSTLLPWTLLIGGAVLVASGGVMLGIAADHKNQVDDALARTEAGLVTRMTRAEARHHEATAHTLQLAGLISGVAGIALVGTGVIIFVDQAPAPASQVVVPTPDRWLTTPSTWRVQARFSF